MPMEDSKKPGRSRKGTGGKGQDGFLGFVTVELTDSDRLSISEAIDTGLVNPLEFVFEAMEDGYKFSLSNDKKHNCVIATLTGREDGCENKGYAMSARGPNPLGAIAALWYKHAVKAHYGPWVAEGTVPDAQLRMFD